MSWPFASVLHWPPGYLDWMLVFEAFQGRPKAPLPN